MTMFRTALATISLMLALPAQALEVGQVIDIVGGINTICEHDTDTLDVINATRQFTGMTSVQLTMNMISRNGLNCEMITKGSFKVWKKQTTSDPRRSLFCIAYAEGGNSCGWILLRE
jgi:hypothetical protein